MKMDKKVYNDALKDIRNFELNQLEKKKAEYKKFIDTISDDRKFYKDFVITFTRELLWAIEDENVIDNSIKSTIYKNSYKYPLYIVLSALDETNKSFHRDIISRNDIKHFNNYYANEPIMVYHMIMVNKIIEDLGTNIIIRKYMNSSCLYVTNNNVIGDKRAYKDTKDSGIICINLDPSTVLYNEVQWEIILEEKKELEAIEINDLVYINNESISINNIKIEGIEFTKEQMKYLEDKIEKLFYDKKYKDYLIDEIIDNYNDIYLQDYKVDELEKLNNILKEFKN